MTDPLQPQPMSPEQIADLVERTREADRRSAEQNPEIAGRNVGARPKRGTP